jgi:hypothetical protein
MATTTTEKILIGGAVGLAAWALFGGDSNATGNVPGDTTPPSCGPGRAPQLQPDGTWTCIDIEIGEVVIDDPLPPKGNICNYSGCGSPFDDNHQPPSFYALRIQQLGYPIDVAAIAGNGTLIAVSPARNVIREFQRDFNAVKNSNGVDAPASLAGGAALNSLNVIKGMADLDEDGLNGNNTITANVRAQNLVNQLGMSWLNIVNLAG